MMLRPLRYAGLLAALTMVLAGCASDVASYPSLPSASVKTDTAVMTPAEQQRVIDELNAAKARNQQ